MGERRRVRAPRVSEGSSDDPVGTRDEPVDGGVVRVDEKVGQPAAAATEGERIPVEEDDARDIAWERETLGDGDARAERVPDDDGTPDPEPLLESVEEREPLCQRVRAAPLAVTERRQVERVDAVSRPREERADLVPNPGRFGRTAEEHDRRAGRPPRPVGEQHPVGLDERAAVQRPSPLHLAVRRQIERERGDGDENDQREERERDPARPVAKATSGDARIFGRSYLRTLGSAGRRP